MIQKPTEHSVKEKKKPQSDARLRALTNANSHEILHVHIAGTH
jgi:hypothetical protein